MSSGFWRADRRRRCVGLPSTVVDEVTWRACPAACTFDVMPGGSRSVSLHICICVCSQKGV